MTWSVKKLEEVCEKIKKEKASIGEIPYIEIGNIDVNNKKIIFTEKGAVNGSVYAPANSILISRVRPTRGAVAFIDKKLAVSSAFTIIKPKPEYNPKLLFYFLAWNKKFFDYLGEKQKGTNYPSVREKDVLEFEISFPENEEEQQKIVKILDTIQEAVEIQEKIIEKTKELKKSLMADLFKYGAPSFRKGRKLKKTEIGEIPEDWEVVRLGEVVKEMINGFPTGERDENGILQLRMDSITSDGKINLEAGVKVPKRIGIENYFLQKGDILFNNTNSIDLVGKTALFRGEFKECVFSNHLTRIRVDLNKTLPEWIFYILFRNWELKLFKNLATRRVGQADINRNVLKNLKVPLPSLPEQQEIAEILQTVDQKIEIERRKKELYEELFKTMLNKIMNQEIDVENIEV
jgi:type I restriction enzyme S subunit